MTFDRYLWQRERIRAGLCRQCGKPRGEGREHATECEPCAGKSVDSNRRRWQKRKAAGLCVYCGGPRTGVDVATTGNDTACRPCLEDHRKYTPAARERRERRRTLGLCTRCGSERDRAGETCARCNHKLTANRRRHRARLRLEDGVASTRQGSQS